MKYHQYQRKQTLNVVNGKKQKIMKNQEKTMKNVKRNNENMKIIFERNIQRKVTRIFLNVTFFYKNEKKTVKKKPEKM